MKTQIKKQVQSAVIYFDMQSIFKLKEYLNDLGDKLQTSQYIRLRYCTTFSNHKMCLQLQSFSNLVFFHLNSLFIDAWLIMDLLLLNFNSLFDPLISSNEGLLTCKRSSTEPPNACKSLLVLPLVSPYKRKSTFQTHHIHHLGIIYIHLPNRTINQGQITQA